jgi:DNA-binding transcriptional ArsR family regulator
MKPEPAEIFKALGVNTRMQIIQLLKDRGSLGAKRIAEELAITPSAVSQHLKILSHAGLVRKERKGYRIPYSIDENAMESCCGHLIEVCSCGCRGMHRITRHTPRKEKTADLLRYKKELEEELRDIQKKLDELRAEE